MAKYALPVRVRLTCNHVISLRNRPLSRASVFGCTMGTGCGYRLHWTRWTEGEFSYPNPDHPEKESE